MRFVLSVCLFFFFLFLSFPVYSDLMKAEKLNGEGKKNAAFNEYREWLQNHRQSEKYFTILIRAAKSAPLLKEGRSLLQNALPEIHDPHNRSEVLVLLARYAELAGNINSAQKYLEEAAPLTKSLQQQNTLLLQSAELLQYMGYYGRAEKKLDSMTGEVAKGSILYYKIYVLLAKCYMVKGDTKAFLGAVEMLEEAKDKRIPSVEYFLTYIGKNSNLSKQLPLSPENLLVSGLVFSLPTTETVFNILHGKEQTAVQTQKVLSENTEHFYIQTGSFRNHENADYMRRDLQKLGFSAFVDAQNIEGTLYYKVLIDAKKQAAVQKIILRLKDKGFEGYPLY